MEIKIGQFYLNKTREYLFPILKLYGVEYRDKIVQLHKLAIGIGDYVLDKCEVNLKEGKNIYILVDTKMTKNFVSLLNYFQKHQSYIYDYPFDRLQTGRLHLIVLKLLTPFYTSYDNFIDSKYSKMYNQEQINILFNSNIYNNTKKVLVKDDSYKEEFIKKMVEKYPDLSVGDIVFTSNNEFDFPIDKFQETFNKHLENG